MDSEWGHAWEQMLPRPRAIARGILVQSIPESPGVYAWFKSSEPVYAGRAIGSGGLRERLRKHLATGPDLSRSSLRRNVAEHVLGVPTSVSRSRPSVVTSEQVEAVNQWIETLEVTWIEFATATEAAAFERTLLHEWMPPLSKR